MSTRLAVPANWNASARITASGDTLVIVVNTEVDRLYWDITTDDNPPAIEELQAPTINGKIERSFTLRDGERLWLAGASKALNVTILQLAT